MKFVLWAHGEAFEFEHEASGSMDDLLLFLRNAGGEVWLRVTSGERSYRIRFADVWKIAEQVGS